MRLYKYKDIYSCEIYIRPSLYLGGGVKCYGSWIAPIGA